MEIFCVILLVLSAAILFATEALRVDVVAIVIMVALALSGLVTPEQALSGFANPATATVAAMFVLSASLRHTGVIAGATSILEAVGRHQFFLYSGMLAITAALSAFINNTAAVAVLIPIILELSRRRGGRPGLYMMPLSFAAQVGGICTVIGTSTNILVSDIAARSGLSPFSMFEFSPIGIWFVLAAVLYLLIVPPLALRSRGASPQQPLPDRYDMPHYLAELEIVEGSRFAGRNLSESGLQELLDLQVLEVIRSEGPLLLPEPDETLRAGDVVLVRGPVKELLKTRSVEGLRLRRDQLVAEEALQRGAIRLIEALVPPGSPLVGRTLEEMKFHRRHQCLALAIRHHDHLEQGKIGRIPLAVGDVLLLQGLRKDLDALSKGSEVITLDEVEPPPRSYSRAVAAVGVIAAVVTVAALGIAPILVCAMAGCALLVVGKILTVDQAYESIDWKVIFLLAGVIPLGVALEQTGAAALLAKGVVETFGAMGPWAILCALYLATALMTEFMSNNATAALLAPLAIASAQMVDVDPRPFLVAITFAASTAFMTPVGYQTNAMVMGPGGYRFWDYARVGAPLNLLFWIMATLLIPRFFPF